MFYDDEMANRLADLAKHHADLADATKALVAEMDRYASERNAIMDNLKSAFARIEGQS